MCVCPCNYIYICICMYVCLYMPLLLICSYNVHMCVYIHTHTHTYIYIYTQTYTYIHILFFNLLQWWGTECWVWRKYPFLSPSHIKRGKKSPFPSPTSRPKNDEREGFDAPTKIKWCRSYLLLENITRWKLESKVRNMKNI